MTPCPWCTHLFEPMKRGAHEKKFCSKKCKGEFETAARRYAYRAIETGMLSMEELKRVASGNALSPSRATAGAASTTSEAG